MLKNSFPKSPQEVYLPESLASTFPSTFTWRSVPAYSNIRIYGFKASSVAMNAENVQQLGRIMEGEYVI